MLGAGVVITAAALLWGQRDLLAIGILLLALPCCAFVVIRARLNLQVERSVTPVHIPVGGTAEVQLTITNLSHRRTGVVLLAEAVPPALGAPVTRVLEDTGPERARVTTYDVEATARGRYELGPLATIAVDPFGLVRIGRTVRTLTSVLVVPRVEPLGDGELRADHWGRGDGAAQTLAARGDEDVIPREYRQGDDLRRIHWRASARADDLMVRREETPWTRRATILIDLRASAHAGTGPSSSLEVALSAAASATVHLLRRGWSVRLVSTDGRILVPTSSGAEGEGRALTTLAMTTSWPGRDVSVAAASDGLIVAIIGSDTTIVSAVSERLVRAPGHLGIALVLDSAAWFTPDAMSWPEASGRLRDAGWRTGCLAPRPHAVTDAWRSAVPMAVTR